MELSLDVSSIQFANWRGVRIILLQKQVHLIMMMLDVKLENTHQYNLDFKLMTNSFSFTPWKYGKKLLWNTIIDSVLPLIITLHLTP